ncbi:uncharacterized protein L201_008014 [Kwoniella dendrophila CBS 6074]|uniref:SET domain-containing protein n=1 Tax=Kwoniella dendrophila CBS 6074 TaxID=1295534 RepID=A0AAX4K878_9TREE
MEQDIRTTLLHEFSKLSLDYKNIFDVKDKPGTGFGLCATSYIPKGTLIFEESPFLTLPMKPNQITLTPRQYQTAYLGLNPRNRQVFWTFKGRDDVDDEEEKDKIMNIIDINGISLGVNETSYAIALFKVLGRVNHSCKPNAGWYWYDDKQLLRFYAYMDIPPNTEITASYLASDTLLLQAVSRKQKILEDYGFSCLCDLCTDSVQRTRISDSNLLELSSYIGEWVNLGADDIEEKSVLDLRKLYRSLEILEIEQKIDLMGFVYSLCLEYHMIHGNYDEAKRLAGLSLDHFTKVIGEEKSKEFGLDVWVIDPTSHPYWKIDLV